MKKDNLLISLILLAAFVFTTNAQDSDCESSYSRKFDEFSYAGSHDLKSRLMAFNSSFAHEEPKTEAVIYVYGGRSSRANEITSLIAAIRTELKIDAKDYASKISVLDGGYRMVPMIEVFLQPLPCTRWPAATPTVTIEDVNFAEFPSELTVKLRDNEIEKLIVSKSEAQCPPAARAVRACIGGTEADVFVIVDTKGMVNVSRVTGGHPLIRRAAEESMKKWSFEPLVIDGKAMNFSGLLKLRFDEPKTEIDSL
jgi:hypothetical protein